MGDWPLPGNGQRWDSYYVVSVTTASGSANTKGAWVQVVAATPFDCDMLNISKVYADSAYPYLTDIGIGGAGSEAVLVSNLSYSANAVDVFTSQGIMIPVAIPKGTRIAVRSQCTSSVLKQTQFSVILGASGASGNKGMGIVDTYGASTADSGGTSIDPGGTASVYGSYVELTASTTRAANGFFLGFSGQGNAARTLCNWNFAVGVGGAGSETTLVENIPTSCAAGSAAPTPAFSAYYPCHIPAGSRVAVKCNCYTNDATDRLIDAVLYTVS